MEPLSEDDEYDLFGLEGGGVIRTHGPLDCWGGACVIHSPSEHHMRGWRLIFRHDKHYLAERECEHGVGHPDPDSLAYIHTLGFNEVGIHECCAEHCCEELE